MKVVITLEDTPRGIRQDCYFEGNGTTDHVVDSLSCIVAAQVATTINLSKRIHTLFVTEGECKRRS